MIFLLTQNTQTRARLARRAHHTVQHARQSGRRRLRHRQHRSGLLALNGMITNQSAMIGYLDDFKLMMVLTIVTIPFLFMIRNVKPAAGSTPAVAE